MALQASGAISMGNINTELALSATAQIGMNDAAVRTLLGKASGAISLNDAYGKSNVSYYIFQIVASNSWPDNEQPGFATVDSSGNVYQLFSTAYGELSVAKYSSAGTVTSKNQLFNAYSICGITTDNSNLYMTFKYYAADAAIAVYTTAPAATLIRTFNMSGRYMTPTGKPYKNASGDIYFGVSMVEPVGKNSNIYSGLVKYNSAGTIQYLIQQSWGSNQGDNLFRGQAEVGGYLYLYGTDALSGTGYVGIVNKRSPTSIATSYNSGLTNYVRPYGNANYNQFRVRYGIYDSVNSVHYLAGQSQTNPAAGTVAQLPLALGGTNWVRHLVDTTNGGPYWNDCVCDSSGNIYVVGSQQFNGEEGRMYVAKYNSSGTLQWQRKIGIAQKVFLSSMGMQDRCSIAINGSTIVLASQVYVPNSKYYSFSITYPTDGSKTGTYTSCTDVNYVISASSLSAPTALFDTGNWNVAPTVIADGSITKVTQNGTVATRTNAVSISTL